MVRGSAKGYAFFYVRVTAGMKTVTFCGHRTMLETEREAVKPKLTGEIEKLILQGASEFLLGGYGDFDFLCAETVKALKSVYPHIKSILVVPYINRDFDRELYDFSVYPPIETIPLKYSILKRNEYMVQSADIVISYVKYSWGGAAKSRDYAMRKKKPVIEL